MTQPNTQLDSHADSQLHSRLDSQNRAAQKITTPARWSSRVGALLLTGALVACGMGESAVESGNREGILYTGNGSEPASIDPYVVSSSVGYAVLSALFEPLVRRSPETLEYEPAAAQSWEFSEDRKRIVFELRRDARWSNGDPVTAEDFVWSWRRAVHPAMGHQLADVLFSIRNAEDIQRGIIKDVSKLGVKALGPHRLQVDLHYPDPFILTNLSYYYTAPVHRATIERHGKMTDRYSPWTRPGNFVGNGAFVLDEWKMQRHLSVSKNPLYWDADQVALNGIVFRPIESANVEERMFRSGQLHVTRNIPNNKVPAYRTMADTPMAGGPYMGTYYYLLNRRVKPLQDLRVRRALALAIDRNTLISTVLHDTMYAADSYIPNHMPGFQSRSDLAFNPVEARRLLAEAGYPDGEGFPFLSLDYNTSENHRTVAVAVQQMWKTHLNINVELSNQEWKVYLDKLDERDYQIARMAWIGDTNPGAFLDRLVTGGQTNMSDYSNADFDRIIKQAVPAEPDRERLYRLYEDAEAMLLAEVPLIPIYSYKSKYLIQPSVEGLPDNPAGVVEYKYVRLNPDIEPWTPRESNN